MKHTILDLFAGAGGLTTGFHLAGFESLCAVDISKQALKTYQLNFPNTKIISSDIRIINPCELRLALGLKKENLSVLIGGPPCQGFSRNVPASDRYINDPRNQLFKVFLDFVDEFRPLCVVMENVPEILRAYEGIIREEITSQLEKIGYKVVSDSLNAANYGTPQIRSRAFFIATLSCNPPNMPKQTHCSQLKRLEKDCQLSFIKNDSEIVTVRDAISDLPQLADGEEYQLGSYTCQPESDYQKFLRNGSLSILNHVARELSPIQRARASALKEGQDARNLPHDLAPKKHYSGAYGRLFWDKPCRTLTKWLFHPGSGRFFHPIQNRTITIREAARLHSFPDFFEFTGSYNEMAAQIGESVPPLLSKAIADQVSHILQT